jgi:hypothetical protein
MKKAMECGKLPAGWGSLVVIPEKKDLLGVGYQPTKRKQKVHRVTSPLEDIFESAGFRSAEQISMLGNEEANQGSHNWVHQCPPSTILSYWKTVEIPEVFFISK